MIVTFTDFSTHGPYLGQLRLVLAAQAPTIPVVDLISDAPRLQPRAAGHLLAALVAELPPGCVVLAIVDPGVGGDREAVILRAGQRWYVGPDNGLLDVVAARGTGCCWWRIDWRPERLSASFHGRDLFAPVAARLAQVAEVPATLGSPVTRSSAHDGGDLAEAIYVDGFGNVVTGIRSSEFPRSARIMAGSRVVCAATTFSAVPTGHAFWYGNSMGLVEIAVNQGSAARALGLQPGAAITVSI